MVIEIIITIAIGIFAVATIYKKTMTIKSADCGCGNCSAKKR